MAWQTLIDTALLLSSADPNDPAATDSWTDIAANRMMRINNAWRGRQYELDVNQAGRLTGDLFNQDEALNPANSSSSLLNNIKPMRRIRWVVMSPRGGTGNLMNNANRFRWNDSTLDPSFESYTNGAASPPWIIKIAVNPTITTTNPQQGTQCLTWTVVGVAQQQVGWNVRTIPGRQYTASCYIRQTVADTAQIFVNGGAAGTTTTTINAYVRLTVTFTATATSHQIYIGHFTPTNGNVVNVDAVQVEPGATANAFTTAGPKIRGIWGGHLDRMPATWLPNTAGYVGWVPVQANGPFSALALLPQKTDLMASILAKGPSAYWPLREGSTATAWDDASGNAIPSLTRMDGKYGPAPVFSPGAAVNLPGDPGGAGVSIDAQAAASPFLNIPTTVLQAGLTLSSRLSGVGGTAPPFGFSAVIWARHTTMVTAESYWLAFLSTHFSTRMAFVMETGTPTTIQTLYVNNDGPGGAAQAVATDAWADGKMHCYVMTLNITTGPLLGQTEIWVDGQLQATNSTSVTGPWGAPWFFDTVMVGGVINPDIGFTESGLPNGVFSELACFNRKLSSSEIQDIYNAGIGYVGELSGTRYNRYLTQNYNGPSLVSAGRSTMGPPTALIDSPLIQNLQRIVDTEGGNQFETRDAEVGFEARDDRFLRTTVVGVFGENAAGGEIPYETPTFGYDTAQITNTATVQQSGGVRATGGPDAPSVKSYYPRGTPLTVDCKSPLEAQSHASWLVANRKQPKQRVQTITLNGGANPTVLAAALDLEIGQRWTVKRRASAANAGAGITMSGDYFIERITHRQVDPELGTWFIDLELSPVPLQPWILGDATYGLLGTTTILGF